MWNVFSSTTQRADSSHHSGKTSSHQDQRKRVISGTQPSWLFSLTFTWLCNINSSPRIRLLMLSTTLTFWGFWGRTFVANDLNGGVLTTGLSNMTIHSLSLWPNTTQLLLCPLWHPTPGFGSLRPFLLQSEVWSLSCSCSHSRGHKFQVHGKTANMHTSAVTKPVELRSWWWSRNFT